MRNSAKRSTQARLQSINPSGRRKLQKHASERPLVGKQADDRRTILKEDEWTFKYKPPLFGVRSQRPGRELLSYMWVSAGRSNPIQSGRSRQRKSDTFRGSSNSSSQERKKREKSWGQKNMWRLQTRNCELELHVKKGALIRSSSSGPLTEYGALFPVVSILTAVPRLREMRVAGGGDYSVLSCKKSALHQSS